MVLNFVQFREAIDIKFMSSFSKYLLIAYYMLVSDLGAGGYSSELTK